MSLTLETLGQLDICWNGRPVPKLNLRKSQALLVYLALNPGGHDRSYLAGLLWGSLPERKARRNLRHALHQLRQFLDPEILESDRLTAGLNPDSPIHVDVLDFNALITRAARVQRERAIRLGGPLVDEAIDQLEAAVDLYQGDFLAGFSVPDCLEFEEWSVRYQAQAREKFLETLDTLVTYWTQRGAYTRALDYARRLLGLEPLWEKAHRQMMTLLALTGQRSAALAQYQECCRLLDAELGLEPLAETQSLYARLMQGDVAYPIEVRQHLEQLTDLPMQSGNYPAPKLPFTGREEEHATLVRQWETVAQVANTAETRGVNRLTLVEGEAGLGKTRLVEEVLRYIASQGAAVLRGRCYEFGTYLPYQPIAEALRGYVQIEEEPAFASRSFPPAQLRTIVSSVWLAELVRLLPDLHRVFSDLPAAHAVTGEAARLRLFESVVRFLRAISEVTPARQPRLAHCLFLDDLHWADQSTLDLLHYLVRHLDDTPFWIVGTYRPEEVSLSHPLTRLRQGLSRDHRVTRLTLAPLSNVSVEVLAESLVGEQGGASLGEFLYCESEGNPFILVETVSDLQEQGMLVAARRVSEGDVPLSSHRNSEHAELVWTGAPFAKTLPVSVQDIVLQRVGRLSELARRLLTLAAVIGQSFDAAILHSAAVGEVDMDIVKESLDEWLTRRLVEPCTLSHLDPSFSSLQYDFTHDKIRAVVYHALERKRRRQLHRRVGEALEQRVDEQHEAHVGLLAYHWEQAEEPARATMYLLRAGDQARLVYAHQEAADYYGRALAILERQGAAGREQAARALMKLGQVYHGAFDFPQAQQAYAEGLDLWQRAGETRGADVLPPPPHPLRLRWLEPTTLDPTLAPDNHTSGMLAQIFSGLVRLSPDMDILPDVARTWDVSEDGCRYVFHLRDDVRWSDGVPVTAEDFVYAWKRVLDPTTKSPVAGCLYDIRGARDFHQGRAGRERVGARAVDEVTLVVELEEPTGHFLQLLVSSDCFPVPRHLVEAQGAVWAVPGTLVTNGPFYLESWQRGEKLSLTRNPNYHGPVRGNVQRVDLFPVTEWSTRLQMYDNDALDVLGITFFPPKERDVARQRYVNEYVAGPILETCYLVFDVTRPPFNDARVRRAFALATDRETLVKDALHGYVTPARGGVLPQGMPGHSPDIGLLYDPEQAQRLLAEAGYPNGRDFPLMDALAFHAVEARVAHLQVQWREVLGVDVTWETPVWATFLNQLRHEPHHIFCAMWVADYPDPDNFLRVSRAEVWADWQNETYDRLVAEARRVMVQEERMRRYRQAEEIMVLDVPILPLTYEREHLLIKPWVSHYPTTAGRAVFWKDVILVSHD